LERLEEGSGLTAHVQKHIHLLLNKDRERMEPGPLLDADEMSEESPGFPDPLSLSLAWSQENILKFPLSIIQGNDGESEFCVDTFPQCYINSVDHRLSAAFAFIAYR
jgi:hypothetical protein